MADDRPRIMDLAGGPVIADDWVRTGYGDMIPLVDAYLGLDTAGMKRTALTLYGIPAQHDNRGSNDKDIEKVDADLEVEGGGKVYLTLADLSYRAVKDFSDVVENWHGPAYKAAMKRRVDLKEQIVDEANNARRIGQALWHFAETSEQGKSDIKAAVMGSAKLGLSLQGLASAADRVSKSLSALGLALDIIGVGAKQYAELQRELDEIAKADDQMSELLDTENPMRDAPRVSLNTHDWEVDQL